MNILLNYFLNAPSFARTWVWTLLSGIVLLPQVAHSAPERYKPSGYKVRELLNTGNRDDLVQLLAPFQDDTERPKNYIVARVNVPPGVRLEDVVRTGMDANHAMGRFGDFLIGIIRADGPPPMYIWAPGCRQIFYQPGADDTAVRKVDFNLELLTDQDNATLAGNVYLPNGNPAANAIIRICGWSTTRTDVQGGFRINCLSPGTFKVRAEAPGGEFETSLTFAPGQTVTQSLQLKATTTIGIHWALQTNGSKDLVGAGLHTGEAYFSVRNSRFSLHLESPVGSPVMDYYGSDFAMDSTGSPSLDANRNDISPEDLSQITYAPTGTPCFWLQEVGKVHDSNLPTGLHKENQDFDSIKAVNAGLPFDNKTYFTFLQGPVVKKGDVYTVHCLSTDCFAKMEITDVTIVPNDAPTIANFIEHEDPDGLVRYLSSAQPAILGKPSWLVGHVAVPSGVLLSDVMVKDGINGGSPVYKNGNFVMEQNPDLSLLIWAPGCQQVEYRPAKKEIAVQQQRFDLQPVKPSDAVSFTGKVLLPNGNPASDAIVRICNWGVTRTNPQGEFKIDNVSPGTFTVRAEAPGGVCQTNMTFVAGRAATVPFQLAATSTVGIRWALQSTRGSRKFVGDSMRVGEAYFGINENSLTEGLSLGDYGCDLYIRSTADRDFNATLSYVKSPDDLQALKAAPPETPFFWLFSTGLHKEAQSFDSIEAVNSGVPFDIPSYFKVIQGPLVKTGDVYTMHSYLKNYYAKMEITDVTIVPADAKVANNPTPTPSATSTFPTIPHASPRVIIAQKLQSTIVPNATFQNADIGEFVQFLSAQSKELDPDNKGINFVLVPSLAKGPLPRISGISLTNIGIAPLLMIGLGQVNLQYAIRADGVYIFSQDTPGVTISKLNSISIDVDNMGVDTALQELSDMSQKIDPDGLGIDCIMVSLPDFQHYKVTLHLKNVPLKSILDSIAEQTGLSYSMEGVHAIFTAPNSGQTGGK